MNAAKPRNIPAPPPRKFDHGMTMAEMAAQDMKRPENKALRSHQSSVGQGRTGQGQLTNLVLGALTHEPQTAKEIAAKIGRKPSHVSPVLGYLNQRDKVRAIRGNVYTWFLPEGEK